VILRNDNLPANLIGETVTGVNLADADNYKAIVSDTLNFTGTNITERRAPASKSEFSFI